MDIVTHGMMGVIVASPFMSSHPEAAAAFMFGSIIPDLDAVSRSFGKRAFLKVHQTYSHAFPVIAALGLAAWALRFALDVHAPWAPLALCLGMALHTITDWTNTYGITLFAPFSHERYCREWVFFIDSVVIASCVLVLALLYLGQNGPRGYELQLGWGIAMVAYWLVKRSLRRRAMTRAPDGTLSLLPSALFPWQYLGCARQGDAVQVFRIDALSGAIDQEERFAILDAAYLEALEQVPEFQTMRRLSPAYHVIKTEDAEAGGVSLLLRDLRTRNFGTRFGEMDLRIAPSGAVEDVEFHV